mmetsp:Transcript_10977/g.12012  ORF Transcript_10977/g.12012 Transcript_10977/m.12012 type:complete len:452 (-) Transcript_10977:128-1483(-)
MGKKRVQVKYMMRTETIAWYEGTEPSEIETQIKLIFGLSDESKIVLLQEGNPVEIGDNLQTDIVYEIKEIAQTSMTDTSNKNQPYNIKLGPGGDNTPKLPIRIINNQSYPSEMNDPGMLSPVDGYMFAPDMRSPLNGLSPGGKMEYNMGGQSQFANATFSTASTVSRYSMSGGQEPQTGFRTITNSHAMESNEAIRGNSVNSSREATPTATTLGMGGAGTGNTPYSKSPHYSMANMGFNQYFEYIQSNMSGSGGPQNGSSTPSGMSFQGVTPGNGGNAMNGNCGDVSQGMESEGYDMKKFPSGSTPSNYSFNMMYGAGSNRSNISNVAAAGTSTNANYGGASTASNMPGSSNTNMGFSHLAQMNFNGESPGGNLGMRNQGMYMYNPQMSSPFSVMGHAGTPMNGMGMTPNNGVIAGGTTGTHQEREDSTPTGYLSLDTPQHFRMGDHSPQL